MLRTETNAIKQEQLFAKVQEENDWLGSSMAKQHLGGWWQSRNEYRGDSAPSLPCTLRKGAQVGSYWSIMGAVRIPHKHPAFCSLAQGHTGTHGRMWVASCFSALRYIVSKGLLSDADIKICPLAFWDMDTNILMVMKYSSSLLLKETCC